VPLRVTWGTSDGQPPIRLCAGYAIPVTVWIQNTGVETWTGGGTADFRFTESFGLQTVQSASVTGTSYPTQDIAPGGTYTATTPYVAPQPPPPAGIPTVVSFEMYQYDAGQARYMPFSTREAGKSWPAYVVQLDEVVKCDQRAFLPLVQSRAVVGQ
jgi:hypothetical protein